MSKRNDGNEQDLRVRPRRAAPPLGTDNPFTGQHPVDKDPCTDGYGAQTQLPEQPPCGGTEGSGGVTPPVNNDQLERYNWTDLSNVCPQGFSIRSLNELFIKLLKNHFSTPDCIQQPEIKQYIYSDDPTQTKISITIWSTLTGSTLLDFLPRLIVRRGPQKMERIVMGDHGETADTANGESRYTKFASGTHRVMCLGPADGMTELLGVEVFDFLNAVAPVMYTTGIPFHDFQVAGISELKNIEGIGQVYGVAVDVTYVYIYSWTNRQLAPRFHRGRTVGTVRVT